VLRDELQMIICLFSFLRLKYDFNNIIDSLKLSIDQQDIDYSNDLANIHSASSYIVDMSEDESSEELEVDTFTRDQ